MSKPRILTRIASTVDRQRVARANLAARLTGATIVLAAVAVGSIGSGAQAVAVPTVPTVRVTLAGQWVTVSVPVVSTAGIGSGVHVVSVDGPGVEFAASFTEDTAKEEASGVAIGTVTGTIPAAGLTAGAQTWTVTDMGDGQSSPVRVEVRRLAYIPTITAVRAGGSLVAVTGVTTSYNPATGCQGPSVSVPVQVQTRTAGSAWRTVANVRSDSTGRYAAVIAKAAGRVQVRAVRVEASLSTSATSAAVMAH